MVGRRAGETITKRDLAERVGRGLGLSQADRMAIVQDFCEAITEGLSEGKRIELRGFGVFEVRTLAARRAQNPKTLMPVDVPQRPNVRFKAGKRLREDVAAALAGAPLRIPREAQVAEPKPGLVLDGRGVVSAGVDGEVRRRAAPIHDGVLRIAGEEASPS